MTRFFGQVGYGNDTDQGHGVWTTVITERAYRGDVLEIMSSTEDVDKVNDDIRLQQRISILADAFAFENFSRIKYVLWMGTAWTVQSVRVERPRLILSLGGVYDGPRPAPEGP